MHARLLAAAETVAEATAAPCSALPITARSRQLPAAAGPGASAASERLRAGVRTQTYAANRVTRDTEFTNILIACREP